MDVYKFLLVLLNRFHNPVTYVDMEQTFKLLWYNLARMFGKALEHVYELFIFQLLFDIVLLQVNASIYAAATAQNHAQVQAPAAG